MDSRSSGSAPENTNPAPETNPGTAPAAAPVSPAEPVVSPSTEPIEKSKDKTAKIPDHPASPQPLGRPAEAQIEVLPDELRANVVVLPPVGDMPHIIRAVIEAALAKRKVTYGVHSDAIERIVAERSYMHTFLIAEGLVPVAGQDASLIYHYSKKLRGPDRSLDNMANVDWRENSNIINVVEGELLLEKVPATPGEPGRTVTNRSIPQKKGQDIRIRVGKGVRSDEDGLKFYATSDGEVAFRNNQLTVSDVHTVADVDATTGNVRFNGNIHVAGLVNDGFVVEAKGSIRVDGSVGAARIIANGDIFVAGGLLGSGNCQIISQNGSVTARFAQSTDITAAKSISIQEYAKDCRFMAGESVSVVSDKPEHGFIAGGRILAVNEVLANNIGTPMETKTQIVVGLDEETVREITRHERELNEAHKRAESVGNGLRFLQTQRRQLGHLEPKKAEMLRSLITAMSNLRQRVSELLASYQGYLLRTVGEAHGRIEVRNRLYAGVDLHIGGDLIEVGKTDVAVTYVTGKEGVVRLTSRTDG